MFLKIHKTCKKTMCIQISWLLMKPSDQDQHIFSSTYSYILKTHRVYRNMCKYMVEYGVLNDFSLYE